jgi:acetyl esterase/lipase
MIVAALLLSPSLHAAEETPESSECVQMESEYAAALSLPSSDPAAGYTDGSFQAYCERELIGSQEAVGNAATWDQEAVEPQFRHIGKNRRWRVAHGTRLDVSVVPFSGTTPFVKSVEFETLEQPLGTCSLEMNVYKKDIGSHADRAILLFPGGGFIWRSKNLTTMRSMIPHLTERGFTVFEASYPLMANVDEPVECQYSSYEGIMNSAESAFSWVRRNRGVLGAANGRISLMGFSAGGMIAGTLATRHASQVERVVNMYGPTELLHFVEEVQPGGLYDDGRYWFSEMIMSMIVGEDLHGIDMNSLPPVVMESSWSLNNLPPYFTILGDTDQTIPATQVAITCSADSGTANGPGYFDCGNDSHAILLEDTKHLVDLKCDSDAWIFHAQNLGLDAWHTVCPTDHVAAEPSIAAVQSMLDWLQADVAKGRSAN